VTVTFASEIGGKIEIEKSDQQTCHRLPKQKLRSPPSTGRRGEEMMEILKFRGRFLGDSPSDLGKGGAAVLTISQPKTPRPWSSAR
jgi:hypothetical protein